MNLKEYVPILRTLAKHLQNTTLIQGKTIQIQQHSTSIMYVYISCELKDVLGHLSIHLYSPLT